VAGNYLKANCINSKSQESIIECATNVRRLVVLQENEDINGIRDWMRLKEADPPLYEKWKHPPIWDSGLQLQQSVEPGMHQLFLGVTKTIILEVQNWCTLRKKHSSLKRHINAMNKMVMQLHLSWCKVQPYVGDKLGGWVSENYLGFARLLPWVYANLDSLDDDDPFVEPNKPVSKWRIVDCKEFLRERRLKLDGKVDVLRRRVMDNRNVPRKGPVGGTVDNVRRTVLTLWSLLCHLMGMRTSTEHGVMKADQLVRIFLTCCYDFDQEMLPALETRKQPFWLSAYNFPCLLNMPEQIKMLGPLRNRWEGGHRGEGFLRVVKPTIIGKRGNWASNLMRNLLRQKCLLQMKTFDDMGELGGIDAFFWQIGGNFVKIK